MIYGIICDHMGNFYTLLKSGKQIKQIFKIIILTIAKVIAYVKNTEISIFEEYSLKDNFFHSSFLILVIMNFL